MKENGMNKFIELLNEYHHFNSDLIYYGRDEKYKRVYFHVELPEEQKKKLGDALFNDGIDEQRVGDEWICSKRFGFIKRLVDNDKIDLEKLDKKSERKPMYSFEEEGRLGFKLFEVYESLLMLLSIQDNPIEFLISILK